MTIDDVGSKVRLKDPQNYGSLTPAEAGRKYLAQYPDNWERLPDPVVADHIRNLKNTKHREASGLWAFFAKKGEAQRAEFFQNRVQTAQALVALEEQQHKLERLGIESQALAAQAAVTIAQCKKTILSLGILGDLELRAAQKGMTLPEYEAHMRRHDESGIRKDEAEHSSGLRIGEAQNSHLLQKDIEKLRNDLTLLLKDKEHGYAVQIKELEHRLREKEKQLEHRLQQEIIEKETEGTIRLANTEELSRAQMVSLLVDYGNKRDKAKNDFERQVWVKEIARLEKLLYEEPSGVAGKKNVGNDPEGGAPPAEPGNSNRSNAGPGKPPDSPEDTWLIN